MFIPTADERERMIRLTKELMRELEAKDRAEDVKKKEKLARVDAFSATPIIPH